MKAWAYPLTTDPADTRVALILGVADAEAAQRETPPGRTPVLMDIPTDRTFRDAWMMTGTGLAVSMPVARQVHLSRLRAARNKALDVLDKDWMRAVGQGNAALAATIEAQRQVLRDLPQTFDLSGATTPDELQQRWPSQLPRP